MEERAVVLAQLLGADALDVGSIADRVPVVGMCLDGGADDRLLQRLRRVVLADLVLVADDRHLRLPLAVEDQRALHAVGLDAHRELEPVRGNRRVVVRPVVVRAGVEGRAVQEEGASDLAEPELLRALEEHVLEEMGHPGNASVLVARADSVPDAEADDRRAPHLLHQHGEAVRQHGLLDAGGEAGRRKPGGRGRAAGAAGGDAQEDEQRQQGGRAPQPTGDSRGARYAHGSQYRASASARARNAALPVGGPGEAWYG